MCITITIVFDPQPKQMDSSLDSANNNHFNPSHHDSLDIFYKSKVSYDDDDDDDDDDNDDHDDLFLYFFLLHWFILRDFFSCLVFVFVFVIVYVIVFLTDSLTLIFPAAGPDFLNPTSRQADANGISILISIIPLSLSPYLHCPIISVFFIIFISSSTPLLGFHLALLDKTFFQIFQG